MTYGSNHDMSKYTEFILTGGLILKSSEIISYSSMQLQVHICEDITNEIAIRKVWEAIKEKITLSQSKYQPCAWRICDKSSKLLFEQYKENGCIGIGNKILRLLIRKKILNTIVCVFINQSIIPLNPSLDHLPILSSINVFINLSLEFS